MRDVFLESEREESKEGQRKEEETEERNGEHAWSFISRNVFSDGLGQKEETRCLEISHFLL